MAQTVIIPSAAQTSVIKCKLCDSTGEFFCKECPSALCKPCREKHDKLLGGHTVVNIKTIDRSAFTISCNSQCSSHLQPFKLFCNQCELLICIECVAEDHNGHSSSRIEKIVEKLRESAGVNVSLIKERIRKLSEVLDKTKSEKLPKFEVDLQAANNNIDSTLSSIQQVVDITKDNKTTEYEDFRKLQELDINTELKRRENVLSEYRNLCTRIEKILTEDHAVTFYVSYNNLRKDINEFDDGILKDIAFPTVPEFKSEIFIAKIIDAICEKFDMRLKNQEDSKEKQRSIVMLTIENATLKQHIEMETIRNSDMKNISQMEQEIASLRKEMEISQRKIMEFQQQKANDNVNISQLNNQKGVLEQRVRNLAEQVQDLNRNKTNDNVHISELKNQKEALEQRTRNMECQVQELNNSIISYKKRDILQGELQLRISMADQTIQKNNTAIADYKQQILRANQTIETHQRDIETLKRPVVCKYTCTICSTVTNSSVPQGRAPLQQLVGNCRCGFNRSFAYSGAAS